MANNAPELVLASASPRRAALLAQVGIECSIRPSDIDESVIPNESPRDYVERLALAKARAAAVSPDTVVLGADTIVVLDGRILGKPESKEQGCKMLIQLSNRTHEVLTGVAVVCGDQQEVQCVSASVEFAELTPEIVDRYWQSGECSDKAGAYGIQGIGSVFVKRITGSYGAIVGLPLFEVEQMLQRFSVDTWAGRCS